MGQSFSKPEIPTPGQGYMNYAGNGPPQVFWPPNVSNRFRFPVQGDRIYYTCPGDIHILGITLFKGTILEGHISQCRAVGYDPASTQWLFEVDVVNLPSILVYLHASGSWFTFNPAPLG